MNAPLKRDWPLDQRALRRLLHWLDEGVDSKGERYLEIRRRLVSYFVRKKCLHADELADETLTRIARRLEEEGGITDSPPARYCYIVARFVFLEYQRAERRHIGLDDLGHEVWVDPEPVEFERNRKVMDCLDRCLGKLNSEHRELILEYYCGERHDKIEVRRRMAVRLGLTANAVTIRACRIRSQLQECLESCCAEK